MLTEEQSDYVNEFYYYGLEELELGGNRKSLTTLLIEFEEIEDYLACAGIKKAIEFYDFQIMTQIITKQNENDGC